VSLLVQDCTGLRRTVRLVYSLEVEFACHMSFCLETPKKSKRKHRVSAETPGNSQSRDLSRAICVMLCCFWLLE